MTTLSDYIKTAVMSPLQQRCTELGICSRCHKKTLKLKHTAGEFDWFQCGECSHIYMLPERRLVG